MLILKNLVNPVYVFFATHNPDTPNGIFTYLRIPLSAPSMRANTPFNADTFILFSLSALIPVSRINFRIASIGTKNVMFA